MTEIRMRRTCSNKKVIVFDLTVAQYDFFARNIDRRRLIQDNADVRAASHDSANRQRNLTRRKRGSRHLMQQRLKQMVVAAINQGDSHRFATERPRGRESTESAAEDYYLWLRVRVVV
jgi:hypothetical protein